MKRPLFFALSVIMISIIFFGCKSNAINEKLIEEDKKAIRDIQATYASGWNEENPQETILSIFTEDAVLLPHHGDTQVEGIDNIQQHFWPAGLTGFRVNSYEFDIMMKVRTFITSVL